MHMELTKKKKFDSNIWKRLNSKFYSSRADIFHLVCCCVRTKRAYSMEFIERKKKKERKKMSTLFPISNNIWKD